MLKAILVDDDVRDTEVLELLLKKYCADDLVIIGQSTNVDDAYKIITTHKPDLLFLDIELQQETGFDLLSRFEKIDFRIIFVTAYDRYALQAIKFNALDYILKPVEISELISAVRKISLSPELNLQDELKNLLFNLNHPHQKSNRIAIPVMNGYKMIRVSDIVFCEANKEYTQIHAIGQQVFCSSVNLGEYEDLLQEYSFCRVHHSFIVNKDHVVQYIKGEGGELLLDNEKRIPVSRRKKEEVVKWLTTV